MKRLYDAVPEEPKGTATQPDRRLTPQTFTGQRVLAAAGICVPILFALSFVMQGFLRPALRLGYTPIAQEVSDLTAGPLGWIEHVNFLVLGLLVIAFGVGLSRGARKASPWTGWFAIVPFAALSLGSGIVLSLGTKWGLFRYYWVLLNLVITTGAVLLLLVHTQIIDLLAGIAATTTILNAYPYGMLLKMVATSGATVMVLIMLTGLAVYKPRGMTSYGQRKQDERRKGITAEESVHDEIQETEQNA